MPGHRSSRRILLFLILAAALAWRLNNVRFGLPSLHDPDEPIFMLKGLELIQQKTLNPRWFGHPGTTTIYLLALVDLLVVSTAVLSGRYADVATFVQAAYGDPGLLFVPARVTMALIATGCAGLTYLIGRRMDGSVAGLAAAALLAFNGLHISWSQVVRTDIHASLFMLLAIFFAWRLAIGGRWRDLLLAGLFTGFAIATKWPAASVFVAIVGAAIYRLAERKDQWRTAAAHMSVAGCCVLVGMFIASPYLFIDWPTVVSNLGGEVRPLHLGHTGEGFFSNLGRYLGEQVAGSMGWLGLGVALAGILLTVRKGHVAAFVLLPAAVLFLVMISGQKLIWSRWVLPLLPMLCVFAGIAVAHLTEVLAVRFKFVAAPAIAAAATAILLVPSLVGAVAQSVERRNDTRVQAASWAVANIPARSTVVLEHLELKLRSQPWRFLFPIGESGCLDGLKLLERNIGYEEVQVRRNGGTIVDLGNVAPERIDSCVADYAILTYYDLYLEEAERYPAALGNYRALLGGGRTVALFRPGAGIAGGPVVRIVMLKTK